MLSVYEVEAVTKRSSHVFKEHALLAMRKDVNKMNRMHPASMHTVVFAVAQQNIDKLERILLDVSDPNSENYGKHWSRAEVGAFTSNPKASNVVLEYLSTKNVKVDHQTLYNEYITATGPVAEWESMFNTEFSKYSLKSRADVESKSAIDHEKEHTVVRCESYSLPSELSDHVSAVFNTVQFPEVRTKRRAQLFSVEKSIMPDDQFGIFPGYVTPQLLYQYYNISTPVGSSDVSQAVFETGGQTLDPNDLTTFQKYFNLQVEAISKDIGGGISTYACYYYGVGYCLEANLDVQYIMAVSQNTPTTYYYYDGISWSDWITTVADTSNPANVYSISYVSTEIYVQQSDKDSFQTEAIKLGVMGTTIIASSGDSGVLSNDDECGYYALFPASCPYVTAVGGTVGPESNSPEIACTSGGDVLITSGGGFSNYFTAPDFQKPFINAYFTNVKGTSKQPASSATINYNSNHRGYPDVALLAHSYAVVADGYFYVVDGTSASAPVFAGMISLVNSQRVAAGKSSMGWVNPFLYKYYSNFTNDITEGDKNGCSSLDYYGDSTCCLEGFYSSENWDPVTGLGSINFDKFSSTAYAVGTPNPTPTPTSKPYSSSSSSSKKGIAGWIIAVAVIAAVFVITLIAGIAYYIGRHSSYTPDTHVVVSTDEHNEKVGVRNAEQVGTNIVSADVLIQRIDV